MFLSRIFRLLAFGIFVYVLRDVQTQLPRSLMLKLQSIPYNRNKVEMLSFPMADKYSKNVYVLAGVHFLLVSFVLPFAQCNVTSALRVIRNGGIFFQQKLKNLLEYE